MLDNIEQEVKKHTLDELKQLYHVPKYKIKQFLQDNNIELLYERRTDFTKGLIPTNSPLNKYKGKRRITFNKCMRKNWAEHETKMIQRFLNTQKYNVGCLFAQHSIITQQLKKELDSLVYYEHYIKLLKKYKDDCISFTEEQQFGNIPKYNSEDIKEILSRQVILSYIAQKYGLQKYLLVSEILGEEK